MTQNNNNFTGIIHQSPIGERLDIALTKLLPNYSRSIIQSWIINGQVTVNGILIVKSKYKTHGGELVNIHIPITKKVQNWEAQKGIFLDIVHEDSDIMIINKQCNLVVHPAPGHPDSTILNALLHYYPQNYNIPRAGIVHRLDKDTTGLMVIAKTITAYLKLVNLLKERKIFREYEAIVIGSVTVSGTVKQPIARHSWNYMTVNSSLGKKAVTHYSIIENFNTHTRLRLRLETGRTHQIRVHMAYINHPIVGDKKYNKKIKNVNMQKKK